MASFELMKTDTYIPLNALEATTPKYFDIDENYANPFGDIHIDLKVPELNNNAKQNDYIFTFKDDIFKDSPSVKDLNIWENTAANNINLSKSVEFSNDEPRSKLEQAESSHKDCSTLIDSSLIHNETAQHSEPVSTSARKQSFSENDTDCRKTRGSHSQDLNVIICDKPAAKKNSENQFMDNKRPVRKASARKSRKPKRKRAKMTASRYHYEVNNQDLAKRKDVVNKTLLRSLKRYYTSVFNHDISEYLNAKFDEIASIKNSKSQSPLTVESLVKFIEIIRDPTRAKQSLNTKPDMKLCDDFYSLLYQYSHTKLYKLLKVPQLQFVIQDFAANGIDQMLETDDTLKKNPEIYRAALFRFTEIINN